MKKMLCLLAILAFVTSLATPMFSQDENKKAKKRDRAEIRQQKMDRQQPGPGKLGIPGGAPEQMLDRLGATEAEKTAVKEFATTKMQMTRDYRQELMPYFRILRDTNTSAADYQKAIANIYTAKDKYEKNFAKMETELKAKLSPKIQLALLVAGVLDNGLPMGAIKPDRPGMPNRPGGEGLPPAPPGPPPAP